MMFKLQKTASDVRAMIQPLFCLFNEVQNLKLYQSRKGNKQIRLMNTTYESR